MAKDEYEIELKIDKESEKIINELNDELDIRFTESATEEAGVGTAIAFYTAAVGTAGLALTIYSIVNEKKPSSEVTVIHEGEGDVYFIDVDEAEKVGGTIIEKEGDMAIAELSTRQAVEAHSGTEEE
jgi:hypothetical protein